MMASRQPPSVEIFQDPSSCLSASNSAGLDRPRPQLQPSAMPLQPVKNSANSRDVVLDPPMSAPQQFSPLKSQPLSPPMLNYNHLSYVPMPAPPPANVFTDSPIKKAPMLAVQHARPPPMVQQPLFTTFNSNFESFPKENYYVSNHDHFVDFPEPSYARKHALKRSYSDVAPMHERLYKKPRSEEDRVMALPGPEEMPPIEDDGNKPQYSYAQMIGMAILRAPNRRLTLAQIYDWISTTFAHYREDPKQGWHNSIRHNLSLNKAFKKQERPKGDAGKGSYWIIEPGMEMTFIKDKNRKGNNVTGITIHSTMVRQEYPIAPPPVDGLAPKPWLVQSNVPARPQTAPALPELSSDATLPASDPALVDDEQVEQDGQVLPLAQQSSPAQAINSSPPVAPNNRRRMGSSPGIRPQASSSLKQHKRSATAMDDSGYWSSIESSALRPNKAAAVVLTSEIDLEPSRKHRGRAEEEIARIRSSSHDITPSHRRFHSVGPDDAQTSSPIRQDSAKLNPVTPSEVFKKPMRPPPSVSPNTQLRNHRMAMQDFTNSPVKAWGLWGSELDSYSPAVRWPTAMMPNSFDEHFEIFSDAAAGFIPTTPAFLSDTIKRSVQRPSLSRASTTANILSDIPAGARRLNARTPSKTPIFKGTARPEFLGSPLRNSIPTVCLMDEHDELFDFGSFADENSDDGEGVDILKGFQRIGGASDQFGMLSGDFSRRPSLGSRSFTSRF